MQLSLCVCTQLDILVVFVDYLKQLSDDSPDFANTRGTLQCTICVNQYQFECLFMPYMCAVVNIVVVGILTITCFQLFFCLTGSSVLCLVSEKTSLMVGTGFCQTTNGN